MIKKSFTILLSASLLALMCVGCSNEQASVTPLPTETALASSAPTQTGTSEDLTSEGQMGDEDEDIGTVSLTAEEKAFFGTYDGNTYTNGWLGFSMKMPDTYSFYNVPRLMELYNEVLTNMKATRVKDKMTPIALGSDADGNCLTILATYIKSGATTVDGTAYVTKIKSDLKANSSNFTISEGSDEKIKGITYKTFTCNYSIGDDKFYEKHYNTVKDGYSVDISLSANNTDALNKLVAAFKSSK